MRYWEISTLVTFIFTVIMMFIALSFLTKKKYNFFGETVLTYISYLIILLLQYILGFQLRSYIILLVILTILGHVLIGQYLDMYNKSKHYDRFLHAFGSFSFALFTYSILSQIIISNNYSKVYISIFVATIGITLGVILEIIEFVLDIINKGNNQRGLKDTDIDLIADVMGSTLAGIFSLFIIF